MLGQRRTGDVHEGARGAIARVVDDLGHEVLAGAALACEQDGRSRARGNLGHQRTQVAHHRRGPDDPLQAVGPCLVGAQLPHFPAQPCRLQRARDRRRHLVEVERLVRVVIRAKLHRFDGGLDADEGRQQDDQDVGIRFLDLPQHGQAVGIRKAVIQEDEVDAVGEPLDRRGTGLGFKHVITVALQAFAERPPDERFVVNDQNRCVLHLGTQSKEFPPFPAASMPARNRPYLRVFLARCDSEIFAQRAWGRNPRIGPTIRRAPVMLRGRSEWDRPLPRGKSPAVATGPTAILVVFLPAGVAHSVHYGAHCHETH